MQWRMVAGLFCALWFACVQTVWSAQSEAPKAGPATYVGSEACRGCQAPSFEKFSKTVMGKYSFSVRAMRLKNWPARTVTDREVTMWRPAAEGEGG